LEAVVVCKEKAYDAYSAALVAASAKRAADLKLIEAELDKAEAAIPATGTAGARCEKALSNGTFRPKRDETNSCGTGLCCGAARIPVSKTGKAMMTIETCQLIAATKYQYQPPRAAMAVKFPATEPVDWACIDGAQKLAAAVSALATAVYMLA